EDGLVVDASARKRTPPTLGAPTLAVSRAPPVTTPLQPLLAAPPPLLQGQAQRSGPLRPLALVAPPGVLEAGRRVRLEVRPGVLPVAVGGALRCLEALRSVALVVRPRVLPRPLTLRFGERLLPAPEAGLLAPRFLVLQFVRPAALAPARLALGQQ